MLKTILAIDDEAIVRELIGAALRAHGYRALMASSGEQAISVLAAERPDLVLLDLTMPGVSGPTVLAHIRASRLLSKIPVLILSAESDKARILAVAKLGVSGYILKSRFSLPALIERVGELLNGSINTATAPCESAAAPELKLAGVRAPEGSNAPEIVPAARTIRQTGPPPPPVLRIPLPSAGGTMVERLKGLLPIMARSAVQEHVDRFSELKAMSPTVSHLVKLTADPAVSIEPVVRAIKIDHAMALKIIKLANSSVYTTGQPVSDVKNAVMRIGLNQIRQAVMNVGVVEQCAAANAVIDSGQFWEHSIACGLIAARLARAKGVKETDGAFTMGLLHDVGRLAYAEVLAEPYAKVMEAAASLRLPLEQVEQRMLLYTHGDIMDRILHKWKFPKGLINPIVFHHLSASNIRGAAPQEITEVATLGLANRLASALLLGSSGNPVVYPTEDLVELLNLDPAVIGEIERTVADTTRDLKLAMLSGGAGAAWKPMDAELRARLGPEFRPLFLSATPAIDAYRLFSTALAGPADDQPPTVAVVHIRNARESAGLSKQLVAELGALALPGLPLITLSPGANFSLDPAAMAGRAARALPTPFVIDEFIDAVNALATPAVAQAIAA